MKRVFSLVLGTCLALSANPIEPGTRFAIFIPNMLIQTSVKAKKLFAELEVLGKNLEEKVKGKQEELRKLQTQLQSPSLGEAGREQLQKQFRDGEYEFKKLTEDSQMEFEKNKQRILGRFQEQVGPIVEQVAKEQKLQVVFQYSEGSAGVFAYTDEAWAKAFTQEIAKRYDAAPENAAKSDAPKSDAPKAPAKKK